LPGCLLKVDWRFAADTEEAAFRSFVRTPSRGPADFKDPLFARCADALRSLGAINGASSLDIAALVRHVIRRASERDQAPYELQVSEEFGPTLTDWDQVGIQGHGKVVK
jgi:hypothetical protein